MAKINVEKSHALLIGVGQRDKIDNSAFEITEKDAIFIQERLIKDCGFKVENAIVLKKPNSTKNGILAQLDKLCQRTQNDKADLVVVFFSGHGTVITDNEIKTYFLVAIDSIGKENLIKSSEFVEKLAKINTDKLLVLLDCCHAGGVAEYEYEAMFNDKNFFNKDSNRAVIASSRSGEVSFLGEEYSLFTAALGNALYGDSLFTTDSSRKIYLLDFAAYLYASVSKANKDQHPQMKILNNGKIENFVIVDYSTPEAMPTDAKMPIRVMKAYSGGKEISFENVTENELNKVKEQFMEQIKNAVIGSTITVGGNLQIGDNVINIDGKGNIVIQNAQNSPIVINKDSNSKEKIEQLNALNLKLEQVIDFLNKSGYGQNPIVTKMNETNSLEKLKIELKTKIENSDNFNKTVREVLDEIKYSIYKFDSDELENLREELRNYRSKRKYRNDVFLFIEDLKNG